MKTKIPSPSLIQLFGLILFLGSLNSCVSKSKYDEIVKQNKVLSDSLNALTDIFINGKRDFQHSDSLFNAKRFVDAQQAFIEFKNNYLKSRFIHSADSILTEINKKAFEVSYSSTPSYKSFYNAHLAMNRQWAYSSASANFSKGINEFKVLDFANDEKEIEQFKNFINNDFRRILLQFSPGDIGYITANAILGAKLEDYGKKLKVLELKNE